MNSILDENPELVFAELMVWVGIAAVTWVGLRTCALLLEFGTAGMWAALGMGLFSSGLVLLMDKLRPLRANGGFSR